MSYQRAWICRENTLQGPICRDPICHTQIFQGPNLPGPNLPGPNLPENCKLGPKKCGAQFSAKSARGPICRGPICRGPICLEPDFVVFTHAYTSSPNQIYVGWYHGGTVDSTAQGDYIEDWILSLILKIMCANYPIMKENTQIWNKCVACPHVLTCPRMCFLGTSDSGYC